MTSAGRRATLDVGDAMREVDWSTGRVMAGLALSVVDAARAAGVDLGDLLAAHGVDEATLARSDAYVPVALHEALWAEGARRSGVAHFGIYAAERITPGQTGVVEYILRNCATVDDAARAWVRFAGVVSDCLSGEMIDLGPTARLVWRLARPVNEGTTHWSVFAQARTLRLMRDAVGDPSLAPREVWFRHAAPADDDALVRYFRAPVRYGRDEVAIVMDRATRLRPLRCVDAAMRALLEARADSLRDALAQEAPTPRERVRAALTDLLAEPARDLRLEVVAARLRIRPRTLQAGLAADGATFRDLVDDVRREVARRLIDDEGVSVAEAALRLGFADAAALRKARRRWRGDQGERGRKRCMRFVPSSAT